MTYSLNFERGRRAMRSGVYDETGEERARREDNATAYLVRKGVHGYQFDRDYEGVRLVGGK